MITFFLVSRILTIQIVGHQYEFEHDKHDEQFCQYDDNQYLSPTGQMSKAVLIDIPEPFEHIY